MADFVEDPFNFSDVMPSAVPAEDFVTPNHRAGNASIVDTERPRTVRERLMGNKAKEPRNVTPKPRKVVPNKPGQFIEPLTDMYTGIAMVLMPFKPAVSMTIMSPVHEPTDEVPNPITVAENCARAWDEAAQRSERVRLMLDGFLTVGVWGAVLTAHIPILLAAAPSMNPATAMEAMLRRQQEQESDKE
jgi:hypothetical protein